MNASSHLRIVPAADDPASVGLSGEIDAHSVLDLERAVEDIEPAATLVLDMSGVTFIDSSGLRSIVEMHNRHLDGGGRLVLSDPSSAVRRLIDITGLGDDLEIEQPS